MRKLLHVSLATALTAGVLSAASMTGLLGGAAGAASPTLSVSTTGTDSGNCQVHACKTIQYAVNRAIPGDTVKVAAGRYNQTVAISKAIQLVGAGASTTTIDGRGLDTTGTVYGVVYVGNTAGAASVSGFTITNPFPYSYTGGEPEAVALADQSASSSVTISDDVISEGTADATRGTDFPIGIDTFKNKANTTIESNTIKGFFQGALLEDNGPALFKKNTVTGLIANYVSSDHLSGRGHLLPVRPEWFDPRPVRHVQQVQWLCRLRRAHGGRVRQRQLFGHTVQRIHLGDGGGEHVRSRRQGGFGRH